MRIALLIMVCCCWPVFAVFEMSVRRGFVLWVVGMVLALSSFQVPEPLRSELEP